MFSAFAGSMTIGDSLDPTTQIGPMASARQRDRVEGYIAKGRAEGGRITVGGGRPAGRDAAGSSNRRYSPTSTTTPPSPRRRSSAPSCR